MTNAYLSIDVMVAMIDFDTTEADILVLNTLFLIALINFLNKKTAPI